MSGKILIVDELATNRIVLKVKLSAAYYEVIQASSGADALNKAAEIQPDLIVANAELSDIDSTALLNELRAIDDIKTVPVVLLLNSDSQSARIQSLQAGFSDVLVKPLDDTLLLARLRSLLRQRNMEHDLKLHAGTARALGFSDAQGSFLRPGRVAIISQNKADAIHLRTSLAAQAPHDFLAMTTEAAVGVASDSSLPDILVLTFDPDSQDDSLRLMAELRASPKTRNCPLIAVLPPEACKIAPTVLDMGASDIICGAANIEELALRITTQLGHKQNTDKMRDQLQNGLQAAVIDPLTGLYNRRYALPYLERLIGSANRDGRTFAVMVADLDHFKRINDEYGHAAGDAVLSRVAQLLHTNLRDEDLIARIGGEEFLIVTPDTSNAQASQTASRLCRIIQRTPVTLPGHDIPVHVTISIGVAMNPPNSDPTSSSVEALLDRADRALYGSKADGRNTFTLYSRNAA